MGTWPWSRHPGDLSCRQLGKVLQRYLDGHVDESTQTRVREHLEACRRCGLEADTYERIKRALAARTPQVDQFALRRLREFSDTLSGGGLAGGPRGSV